MASLSPTAVAPAACVWLTDAVDCELRTGCVAALAIDPDIVATESAAAIPPATRIRLIIVEPPELQVVS
jgi:hypothetical protein